MGRICEDTFLHAVGALDATHYCRAASQIKREMCSLHVRNEILILTEEHRWSIAGVVELHAY